MCIRDSINTAPVVADFNGDGKNDLAILAASPDSGFEMKVIILFCPETGIWPASFNLTAASANVTIVFSTSRANIAAGDWNGDGVADLAIGATVVSRVYVIYGSQSLSGDIDLNLALPREQGFSVVAENPAPFFHFGKKVAFGDINDDGLDDFAIGAPDGAGLNAAFGNVHVLYGRNESVVGLLNESMLAVENWTEEIGFTVNGSGPAEYLGGSICLDGDVNGDGVIDLVVREAGNNTFVMYGTGGFQKVLENVIAQPGDPIEIAVVDPSGGEWMFTANQKDGSDLPEFLSFVNLTLIGVAPEDHTTDIFVVVTGTDDDGDIRIQYDYSVLFGLENDGDGSDGGIPAILIWVIPAVFIVCVVVVCALVIIGLILAIYKHKSLKRKLRSMADSVSYTHLTLPTNREV
eukprot:TRINITY_DN8539_c0_g2_i1.p1 TRINITY_DN8539_c0_g2~~TRINITY_DN8539_c0_g2_i1.p1  ORF type:complete len:406 (-),score=97.11 TRINITY_DN8539_c0_g2_i1:7-1224(-)